MAHVKGLPWPWNINHVPFRSIRRGEPRTFNRITLLLRTGSLMSHRSSHQTFLHFSLQSSHLNSCYYHQDLHTSLFQSGSRPNLLHKLVALLLIKALLHCPDGGG